MRTSLVLLDELPKTDLYTVYQDDGVAAIVAPLRDASLTLHSGRAVEVQPSESTSGFPNPSLPQILTSLIFTEASYRPHPPRPLPQKQHVNITFTKLQRFGKTLSPPSAVFNDTTNSKTEGEAR
jgi:hypothetical protein